MCEYGCFRDMHVKYGIYRFVLDRQENAICEQKGIKELLEMVLHFNHLKHCNVNAFANRKLEYNQRIIA